MSMVPGFIRLTFEKSEESLYSLSCGDNRASRTPLILENISLGLTLCPVGLLHQVSFTRGNSCEQDDMELTGIPIRFELLSVGENGMEQL